MSAPAPRVPRISRAFDFGVFVAGLLVTAVAFSSVWPSLQPLGADDLRPLLVVPLIALMTNFPFDIVRHGDGVEVGFDAALLVFLVCMCPADQALLVWCIGITVAQLIQRKRLSALVFNIGVGSVCGAVAVGTMTALSDLRHPSPGEMLAIAAGCAAYFVVDYVLSVLSVVLEQGTAPMSLLAHRDASLALGLFVAVDSLGYLGALVVRAHGWSFGLLLLVPLTGIIVAIRAMATSSEVQRRLSVLFDAAAGMQGMHERHELVAALADHAHDVVARPGAGISEVAPDETQIGVCVRSGAEKALWLVAPARRGSRVSLEADRRALEALASVGESAFARLGLVDEMWRRARHDALTGLANRTLFLDRVEQAVALGRRREVPGIAVVFLDLDGFKAVNDRFGHDAGDELLVIVAGRLAGALRDGDSVARFGGDEFAVLLHDVTSAEQVELVCRRTLAALRPVIVIKGHEVVVEASLGVAIATASDGADDLLHNADMAMYQAKSLGKGRYETYEPELRAKNIRRLELIERLRSGITSELVVHYQPIIDLEAGTVSGLEALVRWERDGQLVPPDYFIGIAEQSGLVVRLGAQVMAQVVRDSGAIRAAARRPLALGVNVSALQLREPAFRASVAAACAGLSGHQLVLEMTETVLIGNDAETAASLRELAGHGAALAIDDFGVGFSSVGYLQHMPVDILKIDRSFTADIDTDERADALVRSMVLMGNALGLRVVAEGIERPGQLERVCRTGCAAGQGYLFSPPRPLKEIVALLEAEHNEQSWLKDIMLAAAPTG